MSKSIFIAVTLCLLFALSCRKPDQYSDIPTLTFKSLTFLTDSFGSRLFTLVATFTDGDGDIGFNKGENPNSSDYVITIQRLQDGIWTDTIRYHYIGNTNDTITAPFQVTWRLPYLVPDGANKGLKGDIEQTADLPLGLNDTIRFTAFLYDRAMHKSNTIIAPSNGGYFIHTN